MPVRLILDTDIGSDIDDALALAYCLRHPEIDLRAVTTVADDTVLRARWAKKILDLAGRDDIEVAAGVGWQRSPTGRASAWPHDGHGLDVGGTPDPAGRDAVDLLLETPDVTIATVGMQSNVAAAVERDPSFAERVPLLAVMGGAFAPIRVGDSVLPPDADHNLNVDPEASVRSLNAGMTTVYTPIDVTVKTKITQHHLDALRSGDPFCQELAACIEAWRPTSHMPEGTVAVMHDPLTVAVLVDRSFVETREKPVTVALVDGCARTFIDPVAGRPAEIVTGVDAGAFADHWLLTVLG